MNTGWLRSPRSLLESVAQPFHLAVAAPVAGARAIRQVLDRVEHNRRLERENLALRSQLARFESLSAENARLRRLLGSSVALQRRTVVAELVGVPADGNRHEIVLDKGTADGVVPGLPLVDARGVAGQIVTTGLHSSRALLLTDATHALPIQVVRNELRAIAAGTGDERWLQLEHVPERADIRVGDLLTASGLGGRFPPGYPVAVVETVDRVAGDPFLTIRARPHAELSRTHHFLVVLPTDAHPATAAPAADDGAAAGSGAGSGAGAAPRSRPGESAAGTAT